MTLSVHSLAGILAALIAFAFTDRKNSKVLNVISWVAQILVAVIADLVTTSFQSVAVACSISMGITLLVNAFWNGNPEPRLMEDVNDDQVPL